jgi:hypothetical protein
MWDPHTAQITHNLRQNWERNKVNTRYNTHTTFVHTCIISSPWYRKRRLDLGSRYVCASISFLGPPLWSSGQSSWLQNGDLLRFLRYTNWIYKSYVEESIPPLWSSGQSSWLQNGDILYFLWGTNWIYICYEEESRPPLWSYGQRSWLQNGDVLCFLWGTKWNLYVM